MISKISQSYAQALFESEASEDISQQLKSLSSLFAEPETLNFFLSPTISQVEKIDLLQKSLKNASPLLKNFLFVVLDNKVFPLLSQIASAYQELLEEKDNVCTGTLYSPYPVSEEQKREIEETLQKFLNKKLVLQHEEDKSLIGGICVEAGGYVFDGSVKKQLSKF